MSTVVTSYMQNIFNKVSEPKPSVLTADYWLLGTAVALLILGLIMVGSSSVSIAESKLGEPFYYLWRQLLFTGVGLLVAFVIIRIPMRIWQDTRTSTSLTSSML